MSLASGPSEATPYFPTVKAMAPNAPMGAKRMRIDYLQARPEVDKSRIAFHGVSWGAYWGTKMAVVERDRLKAVSVQSPPTDQFFTRKFLTESLLGNREYLFDQVAALKAIFDNVNSVEEIAAIFEKMSLVNQGIL